MKYETATSMLAAQDTAGQVMVTNGTSTVATTEYSASSGGYSTGAQFPAVVDAGDAVCISASVCNPNHNWTVTLSARVHRCRLPVHRHVLLAGRDLAQRRRRLRGAGQPADRDRHQRLGLGHRLGLRRRLQPEVELVQPGRPAQRRGRGLLDRRHQGRRLQLRERPFYGSTGNLALNKPIVGMAATPDGGGYWLVASDGGIFTFGDATFFGSTGNLVLNKPIVGMASTPDGRGYWLVASDGGIFTLRRRHVLRQHRATSCSTSRSSAWCRRTTAAATGWWPPTAASSPSATPPSTARSAASPPSSPVVGVAPAAGGAGYWMLEANGTVQAFGERPHAAAGGRFARHRLGQERR